MKSKTQFAVMLMFACSLFLLPVFSYGAAEKDKDKDTKKERNPYTRYIKEVRKLDEKILDTKNNKEREELVKKREKAQQVLDQEVTKDVLSYQKKRDALDKKLEATTDEAEQTRLKAEIEKVDQALKQTGAWAAGEGIDDQKEKKKDKKKDKD